jgi:Bacterial transcriptional activator domain
VPPSPRALLLAEWHGPPLADASFEPFAPPLVARLQDLRAAAVEDRVEADLAMGRGAELVGELEGLVAAFASAVAAIACGVEHAAADRR